MVDGKVCNTATHTKSTMRYYICDVTEFLNLMFCQRRGKKENLSFGLSLLHAPIRFFERTLHVAYKLPVRKLITRLTAKEKIVVKKYKKEIQDKFKY